MELKYRQAKKTFATLLTIILCNYGSYVDAQITILSDVKKTDSVAPQIKDTVIHEKDLGDVFNQVFKKHSSKIPVNDSTNTKPVFSIIAAIGYTLQTRLAAVISGNIAYRTEKGARLSTISGNATYTQNNQFFIPIQSNIWTKNNKFNLVGDFGFYKYPQSTFGLGSSSSVNEENRMNYNFFRIYEVILKKLTGNFYGGLGYIIDYRWNISEGGNKNGTVSDYLKYGAQKKTVSSGITLNLVSDTRDNPINASSGYYTSLQLRNNLKALGSQNNWQSLIIDLRKYFRFPASSENVLAFWSYNWLILSGKPPYLDLPSNGWDSYNCTGRGFIQGRFRGASMVYGESEYRFKILSNGLVGGVVFANAESFSAVRGTRLQKIQPGYGTGLRIKLSKASKTNLAIDYGFGTQGSKGLFITVGELF